MNTADMQQKQAEAIQNSLNRAPAHVKHALTYSEHLRDLYRAGNLKRDPQSKKVITSFQAKQEPGNPDVLQKIKALESKVSNLEHQLFLERFDREYGYNARTNSFTN